ncbi:MAG: PT domain-containing protein [Phycisphaerae bacterium]|nr:PT domain-containing protein [Phycisphaerae bacterium]
MAGLFFSSHMTRLFVAPIIFHTFKMFLIPIAIILSEVFISERAKTMKRISIQTSLASLTVASILALIAGCQPQAQPTVEPTSQPASRTAKVVFPLAQAIKQPTSNYTLEQLAEMWPAFRHAPIETAGFNHFTLPFHYVSRDGTGDANEAYAFSFLLSH